VTGGLPEVVERFAGRAAGDGAARGVRIAQRGEMVLRPGGRALRFAAVQEIDVRRVAFRWRARFGPGPLRPLTVVDAYDAGRGRLEGRLAGVRLFRSEGPEVSIGEAMRYLAELALVPDAVRANAALEWRGIDATTAEVATATGHGRAAVRLGFDAEADLVSAFSPDRPRLDGREVVPTPWSGTFWDHAPAGGLRVPMRAEVAWHLPDGPFTYWRAELTSIEVVR
jgi:hypothetical protein